MTAKQTDMEAKTKAPKKRERNEEVRSYKMAHLGMPAPEFRKKLGINGVMFIKMLEAGSIKIRKMYEGARSQFVCEWNGKKWNGSDFA